MGALEVPEQVPEGARDGRGELGFAAVQDLEGEGAQGLEIALDGAEVEFFPEQGLAPAQFLLHALHQDVRCFLGPVPVAIEEDRGQVVGGGALAGILEIQGHQAAAVNHQVAHVEIPVDQGMGAAFQAGMDLLHHPLQPQRRVLLEKAGEEVAFAELPFKAEFRLVEAAQHEEGPGRCPFGEQAKPGGQLLAHRPGPVPFFFRVGDQALLQGDVAQILHQHGPQVVVVFDDGGHPQDRIQVGLEGPVLEVGVVGTGRIGQGIEHHQGVAQVGMFDTEVLARPGIAAQGVRVFATPVSEGDLQSWIHGTSL